MIEQIISKFSHIITVSMVLQTQDGVLEFKSTQKDRTHSIVNAEDLAKGDC